MQGCVGVIIGLAVLWLAVTHGILWLGIVALVIMGIGFAIQVDEGS